MLYRYRTGTCKRKQVFTGRRKQALSTKYFSFLYLNKNCKSRFKTAMHLLQFLISSYSCYFVSYLAFLKRKKIDIFLFRKPCRSNNLFSYQVNMPADSFESLLTLAACGGHVELAMLLLERGANIEEVGGGV